MIKSTISTVLRATLAAVALAIILGTAAMVSASEPASPKYSLQVDGLACPFCAYGVEKQLSALKGVDKIDINIKTSIITLVMKKGSALDEATAENGCMHVIPGSHKTPTVHFKRRDWQICDTDVAADRDVMVPLKPGGCLFWHGLTHHGTPANLSDKGRRALQLHYKPEYHEDITTQERMEIYGSEGKDVEC